MCIFRVYIATMISRGISCMVSVNALVVQCCRYALENLGSEAVGKH
jgi:hypothetical protein